MASTPTTTTQDVRMHGWTIPAGTTVQVRSIRLPIREYGQQVSTATVDVPGRDYPCGVPVSHLDCVALGDVPLYQHNTHTGQDVPVELPGR
jgi:hypothetical protein